MQLVADGGDELGEDHEQQQDEPTPTVDEILKRQAEKQANQEPTHKKRRTSTPMASSFEPFLAYEHDRVLSFLSHHHMLESSPCQDSVVVSCALFDPSAAVVRELQVTFGVDDLCTPRRVTTRPLRWLSVDVMNRGDGRMDCRFTVASSRVMDRVHVPPLVYMDGDRMRATPALLPSLKHDQQRVYARQQRSHTYTPTPGLTKLPLPDGAQLVLSQVTEYDQCDPGTGHFGHVAQKWELDVVVRSLRFGGGGMEAGAVDRFVHQVRVLMEQLMAI
jgi:hypothetical protein